MICKACQQDNIFVFEPLNPLPAADEPSLLQANRLPLLAHRDILRRRTNSAPIGAKRTLRSLRHAAEFDDPVGFCQRHPTPLARSAAQSGWVRQGVSVSNFKMKSGHFHPPVPDTETNGALTPYSGVLSGETYGLSQETQTRFLRENIDATLC